MLRCRYRSLCRLTRRGGSWKTLTLPLCALHGEIEKLRDILGADLACVLLLADVEYECVSERCATATTRADATSGERDAASDARGYRGFGAATPRSQDGQAGQAAAPEFSAAGRAL